MLSKELFKPLMIVVGVTFGTLALAACEEEGPAEQTGEAMDDAAEDAGEAVEDAGDATEDATTQ
jgi:hypothetical protein